MEMLPRERVFRTLNHQEPDIIPWGEHWIDYNVYEDILGRPTFVHAKMKETKAWWEGQDEAIVASYKRDTVDLAKALGLDIVTVQLLGNGSKAMRQLDEDTYEDEGGSLYRLSSVTHDLMPYQMNPRAYTPPTLESLEAETDEIVREGLKKPEDAHWEFVRHVVREMKGTHFIACLVGDIGFPTFGQTDEERYLNLALHPEMHAKLSELAGRQVIGMLKYYAEEGIDGVIPCADYGSSTALLAHPKIFVEHVFPWLKAYCDEAHRLGMKLLKHSCGRTLEIFDYFIRAGCDAYESIQPTAGMDIKLLKERYGDNITLWGGVSNENLIGGTPEDVEADARYGIKWAAPGGGFIYGASHSIAVGASRENVLKMKEARERLGMYPIRIP
jgi:uroporphyrinogen decarboxylase